MDTIWTVCRLRSSQSVGQFYAKSGKWKLVFSRKNLALKYLLAHLQRLRCATPWDGFWTMPHPGKILWTWSSTPCQSTDFCASFAHIATGKLDSKNRCSTLACWWNDHESQENWTWMPFTKLVSRWYFYSSIPSWQAWALTELDQGLLETLWCVCTVLTGFWSRILESKANLLSKSSVTRQGDSMAW